MKKMILVVLLATVSLLAGAQKTIQKVIYTCIMHEQVRKDRPGTCPICGMDLVKKTIRVAAPKRVPAKPAAPAKREVKPSARQQADTLPREKERKKEDIKTDTAAAGHQHQMPQDEHSETETEKPQVFLQQGKTVRYDLYVSDTVVNFTGKRRKAVVINGSLPAPTLTFTEGDTAEIYLHNRLKKEETSLHWHGVILPNQADGVPYLTTAPIGPGETHLYRFAVVQNGTYWYHSHTALQEQAGMYGALIFKPRADTQQTTAGNRAGERHHTLVLSEWADDRPSQIQRRLRTANDWFSIKKGSTQSYAEAIAEGHLGTKLLNEWKRMKAMDVSDVFYDRFLANGRLQSSVTGLKAGDRVRLHVVNAGASSYFWLQYAGGKVTVVGHDGNEVAPVAVDRLIVAPAETVDLLVTVPRNRSYELRATSEDRTGAASLWLGAGPQMPAPVLPRLKYFEGMRMMNAMMRTNGTMKDMGMQMSNQKMDMNSVMYPERSGPGTEGGSMPLDSSGGEAPNDTMAAKAEAQMPQEGAPAGHDMHHMGAMGGSGPLTLNYDLLRSPVKTTLPGQGLRTLHFTLTGNMNRYVWTLDNKTVNESDRIQIRKGEVLRLVLTNHSMMRHPMHLHGHDFRLVNSGGEYAPLKNVLDIMPMETDTVEFAANQSGDWFFHCHILFHMMAGMGRVFTYEHSPPNPELPDKAKAYRMFKKDNSMRHLMVRAGIESNGSDGEAMLSSNRYALQQIWHMGLNLHHGFESETMIGRYLGVNQWWFAYVGFDYHYKKLDGKGLDKAEEKNLFGQQSNKNHRKTVVAGVQYTLPWLVQADARVDGNGKLRFQLSREDIPLTKRLRMNFMGNTDKEYAAGLRYILSKWLALSTHYDTDMGLGGGITLTY
ncbi:multicopper oxidase domain-containing protein [Paraflavisolibacter sp. H34]|uniref:multicopper oxidase domain-containing protein n=1 Tax=Huijunlia imazamoxiresistens TaxID=3127457 RepID=UPI00301644AB